MSHRYSFPLLAAGILLCGCSHQTEVANLDSNALVEAIRAANQRPGPDTIRLAKGGLYVLTDQAEPGLLLPTISGELVIDGQGAEVRRGSNVRSALLQVASNGKVSISRLSLAEGSDGAVRNFGCLRLQSVRITDSSSWDSPAIVLNHGILQARDSEIAYNELPSNHRDGGTVLNYGELVLERSRIHDNRVQSSYARLAAAGAILNLGTARFSETGIDHNDADDEFAPLNSDGILELGNGHIDGPLPMAVVLEAGLGSDGTAGL